MKKVLWLSFFLLFFIITGYNMHFSNQNSLASANNTIIPREVLFGNPEKMAVRLSANGRYLSYISPLNGVLNIHVAPADNLKNVEAITNDENRGIRSYFWLYDNMHIAYVKDDGGDENWQIHVVNVQTKQTQIFSPKGVHAQILGVSYKFPSEILIGLNERDKSYHDVYRLNIETGKKELVFQNDQGFRDFIFDDSYRLRFASVTTQDGGSQYFKAIPLDEPRQYNWESYLTTGLEDVYTTGLMGLTQDGDTLYLLDSRGRDLNLLKAIDLNDNSEVVLGEGKKADIGGIMANPLSGVIQGYSVNYLRNEWTFLDKTIEAHYTHLQKLITGELSIASRTLDDSKWIVADFKDDGPIGYYMYDTATKELQFLFNHKEVLTQYTLAKMRAVEIKARDGLVLPSYLTEPLNRKGAVPLVVLVHGGPWARDHWGYHSEVQWLVNRGYAVLQVNFRASTGFGKSFISKGNKEWGAKMHEDLLDGVKWAIQEGVADPKNVAIYGGSYGGYAALWGATNSGDVFKCAVDIVGPSNLETLLASFPSYWASFMEIAYRQVGDPRTEEGRAFLKSRSPVTYVDNLKIPLLIAQGEKDPRVKQAESDQIVNALKAKDIPYIYLLFNDEGHGFARPKNRFAFYGVAEQFLAEHLGGRSESVTKDEIANTTLLDAHKATLLETYVKEN